MTFVVFFKEIARLVFWFFLWCAIPATLLYPLALWAAKHTLISEHALAHSYIIGIVWPSIGENLRTTGRASQ